MVSHDIKEVAFMADRIVLLGANPGVVQTVFDNTLPRPREQRAPAMLRLVAKLHDIITGHELPDEPRPEVAPPPPGEPGVIEPIPHVTPSEIWREQILMLPLFKRVRRMLAVRKKMSKRLLPQVLRVSLPMENDEQMFQVLVGWWRFGDLFA